MSLIVHPESKKRLEAALGSDAHALLLVGPKGIGLKTIATKYTQPTQIIQPQLLTKASTVPQIGIEQARDLYATTKGRSTHRQTIIIDDIDMMTLPAQNSFLKLLEEPAGKTRFIATTHKPDALLATIRSRLQTISFAPAVAETALLLAKEKDELKRRQLQFIANGLPAELYRLQHDERYFRIVTAQAALARKLVECTVYDRLVILAKEKIDRTEALGVIERMVQFLQYNPKASSINRISHLLKVYEAIERNGNVRVQLACAMVY